MNKIPQLDNVGQQTWLSFINNICYRNSDYF